MNKLSHFLNQSEIKNNNKEEMLQYIKVQTPAVKKGVEKYCDKMAEEFKNYVIKTKKSIISGNHTPYMTWKVQIDKNFDPLILAQKIINQPKEYLESFKGGQEKLIEIINDLLKELDKF